MGIQVVTDQDCLEDIVVAFPYYDGLKFWK